MHWCSRGSLDWCLAQLRRVPIQVCHPGEAAATMCQHDGNNCFGFFSLLCVIWALYMHARFVGDAFAGVLPLWTTACIWLDGRTRTEASVCKRMQAHTSAFACMYTHSFLSAYRDPQNVFECIHAHICMYTHAVLNFV
jgi:hypothetical protein